MSWIRNRWWAEPLEARCLPAIVIQLSENTVHFLGDSSNESLVLDRDPGGWLRHNLAGDGIASATDLDPSTPGTQARLAASLSGLMVNLGSGSDSLTWQGVPTAASLAGVERFTFRLDTSEANARVDLTPTALTVNNAPQNYLIALYGTTEASIDGGAGANVLDASLWQGPLELRGLGGDDDLRAAAVPGLIDGGTGSDTLTLTATPDDDTFVLTPNAVAINNMTTAVGFERFVLDAGAGVDTARGNANIPTTIGGLEPTVLPMPDVTAIEDDFHLQTLVPFDDVGDGQSWTATVDYGTGFVPVTIEGHGVRLDQSFPTVGTFPITIRVTDNQGNVGSGMLSVVRPARVIVGNGTQRSMVRSLTIEVPGQAAIATGAFALEKLDGPLNASWTTSAAVFDGTTTRTTLMFSGPAIIGGSLPDGRYRFTVFGDRITVGGVAISGTAWVDFHRYFGDINGDAVVDGATDYASPGSSFGTSVVGNPFDFNGDGVIDGPTDFAEFGQRFGRSLSVAPVRSDEILRLSGASPLFADNTATVSASVDGPVRAVADLSGGSRLTGPLPATLRDEGNGIHSLEFTASTGLSRTLTPEFMTEFTAHFVFRYLSMPVPAPGYGGFLTFDANFDRPFLTPRWTTGEPFAYLIAAGNYAGGEVVADDEWHVFSVTYGQQKLRMFLDGAEIGPSNANSIPMGTDAVAQFLRTGDSIGSRESAPAQARFAEIVVSRRAATTQDVVDYWRDARNRRFASLFTPPATAVVWAGNSLSTDTYSGFENWIVPKAMEAAPSIGRVSVSARSGVGIAALAQRANDEYFRWLDNWPTARRIFVLWEGRNDLFYNPGISAAESWAHHQSVLEGALARGANAVVVVTMLPSNGISDTKRLAWNTLARQWVSTHNTVARLADLAMNPTIGETGDNANTTYFLDGVHLSAAGVNVAAPIIGQAIHLATQAVVVP